MNVLSLFDGMSCGQIALNKLDIRYDNYFASEIDKYAIQVTQANYPSTVQLGDIQNRQDWDLPEIDLILAGSPCQGFSIAGKGLNFDDPRSKLYFVFEDILKHYQPKYWLLENVIMLQEWQDIISQRLGIKPIMINSALVSAQNRKRLYWTSISSEKDMFGFPYCTISQPVDKHIYLKDIIEDGHVDRAKDLALTADSSSTFNKYHDRSRGQIVFRVKEATQKGYVEALPGDGLDLTHPNSKTRRGRLMRDKINCLTAANYEYGIVQQDLSWRKLTPVECEHLQTVPDNYTQSVSNSQRYKMLGNGWTVDVIAYILSYM